MLEEIKDRPVFEKERQKIAQKIDEDDFERNREQWAKNGNTWNPFS